MDEIKVLLIEDNPMDVFMVRVALEKSAITKFRVDSAERLDAAIERAKSASVDVVLLDLGLPDAHGLEAFVRARAAMPGIPILVLSGLDDEEIAIQIVQQGAQDYLHKGTTMKDALPRAIRHAIARHRAQEQLDRGAFDLRKKEVALAAGIAHEIRDPLAAIKAAMILQSGKAPAGSQDRTDLDRVTKEIARLEQIVRDFLQFAEPSEPR